MLKERRLPLMVTEAEAAAIDRWRYANEVPSRAEAIRQLIERGLKSYDAPEEAPAAAPPKAKLIAPVSLAKVRPYPAEDIAKTPASSLKPLNVAQPERLKIQIDWLKEALDRPLRAIVEDMLQTGVNAELDRLGVKH